MGLTERPWRPLVMGGSGIFKPRPLSSVMLDDVFCSLFLNRFILFLIENDWLLASAHEWTGWFMGGIEGLDVIGFFIISTF